MSDKILLAAISMTSTADLAANMDTAEEMVTAAARLGAKWVQLPENVTYLGPYDKLSLNSVNVDDEIFKRFSNLARGLGIWLFAGSVAESPDGIKGIGKKVFNTARVFDPRGELRASYRKVHLFNLIGADGVPIYCESDGMVAGNEFVSLDVDGLNVGLGICYDLRFPEQFLRLGKDKPLDVIALPSAFTLQTGMDHWELLLRARAVENQCYVFAANQVGVHAPGKISYGHSMIIDSWGHKLGDSGDSPGVALGLLDKGKIQATRGKLPALSNKRQDLYR
jgi:deaminated glutathione amidase